MNRMTKIVLLLCLGLVFALACRALSQPESVPQSLESTPTIINPTNILSPTPVSPTEPPIISTLPVQPAISTPALSIPTSTSSEKGGQVDARPQAVILVAEDDVLNIRKQPGVQAEILGELAYNATGIALTGAERMVGDQRWVEIRTSGGTGWVNANFLTEYKPPTEFCTDPQVKILIEKFKAAVLNRDGNSMAALASPVHGLNVNYFHTGNRVHYSPAEAGSLFESQVPVNWGIQPASGMEVTATFPDEVLPKLDEVLNSATESGCNDPAMGPNNYIFQWPDDYKNINFVSLAKPGSPGVELDWRTWLVGVEYVDGKPYLFALLQLFWEP